MPFSRPRRNLEYLRRCKLPGRSKPLKQCHSCAGLFRLGGRGDTHWHCAICWDKYYTASETDLEICERCHTCGKRVAVGFWYCDPCWHARECDTCRQKCDVSMGWWGSNSWHCGGCWATFFIDSYSDDPDFCRPCKTCGKARDGWSYDGSWYCYQCWREWYLLASPTSLVSNNAAVSATEGSRISTQQQKNKRRHFDFVEIGTSNYNTFTQSCAGALYGREDAWKFLPLDKSLTLMRGLAVDMNRESLKQLPNLSNVQKVHAAVSEVNGNLQMHYVPFSSIIRWERNFAKRGSRHGHAAMQLARACSSLGKHSVLRRVLKRVGLLQLIRKKKVPVCSMERLFRCYRVGSVGVLALDCEGHDCAIVRGLLKACKSRPEWYPECLILETNGMNDELFGSGTEDQTVSDLKACGYTVIYGGGYRSTGARDTYLYRDPCAAAMHPKVSMPRVCR